MAVNIHEAKTNFSRLVSRAEQGEEIVIGRAGTPVAKLVPYAHTGGPRKPGAWAGRVWIADDFDEMPEDLQAAFNGDAP